MTTYSRVDYGGMSEPEIADTLDLTRQAVQASVRRAIRRIWRIQVGGMRAGQRRASRARVGRPRKGAA